eukprot:1157725-Pelagomonas_calceolata.AAC.1
MQLDLAHVAFPSFFLSGGEHLRQNTQLDTFGPRPQIQKARGHQISFGQRRIELLKVLVPQGLYACYGHGQSCKKQGGVRVAQYHKVGAKQAATQDAATQDAATRDAALWYKACCSRPSRASRLWHWDALQDVWLRLLHRMLPFGIKPAAVGSVKPAGSGTRMLYKMSGRGCHAGSLAQYAPVLGQAEMSPVWTWPIKFYPHLLQMLFARSMGSQGPTPPSVPTVGLGKGAPLQTGAHS